MLYFLLHILIQAFKISGSFGNLWKETLLSLEELVHPNMVHTPMSEWLQQLFTVKTMMIKCTSQSMCAADVIVKGSWQGEATDEHTLCISALAIMSSYSECRRIKTSSSSPIFFLSSVDGFVILQREITMKFFFFLIWKFLLNES